MSLSRAQAIISAEYAVVPDTEYVCAESNERGAVAFLWRSVNGECGWECFTYYSERAVRLSKKSSIHSLTCFAPEDWEWSGFTLYPNVMPLPQLLCAECDKPSGLHYLCEGCCG